MKRVLVTGGCGFIGANLVRALRAQRPDWRVVNLDKLTYAGNLRSLAGIEEGPRYRFVRGDVSDPELVAALFAEEDFDAVLHLAAESHVDRSILGPRAFVETNVLGTLTLLEAARQAWGEDPAGRRFVHVSTDEVYGSLGPEGRFDERTPYAPRSPYSASKAGADHLARAYAHTYGLPVVVTNCSNNYGPYQFPEKLIPLVINNARRGEELPVYGDGKQVRDWLHVSDHCSALLAALERGRPGATYCIGGGSERENLALVERICELLDERLGPLPSGAPRRSLIRFVRDRPGHDRRYAIDSSLARRELGWEPEVRDLDAGLARTVDWYLANDDWLESVLDGSYADYYQRLYGERGAGRRSAPRA
ncbi:MAG: dTDP-glucose 4,6-dehydratase [Planctomycetota bacterium]|nr:MAG: dTDP-glucose 4,6-dehydratase [Planctomycetota bacterium]